MPDVRPAEFPLLSSAAAELHNLIAMRRPRLQLELGGQATALRLGPPPPRTRVQRSIVVALGNDRLWLSLPKDSVTRLCAAWLTDEPLTSLPGTLQQALLNVTLSPLLDQLRELTGLDAALDPQDSSTPDHALPRIGLWQGDSGFGTLQLDEGTAAVLSAALQTLSPPAAETMRWPDLPLNLRLEIGEAELTNAELLGLEVGDVVLLPLPANGYNNRLTLRHGERRLASARIDRDQVTIEQPLEARMTEDEQQNAYDEPEPTGLSSNDLEVRLSFDLGHTTLPLSELQQLQPGYTFTVSLAGTPVVRLRAGDKVIGQGELVQVDDHLGVRITSLFPSDDAGNGS